MGRGSLVRPRAYVLSAAACREVDRVAITRYTMDSLVLMENAAHGATRMALAMLAFLRLRRCIVACGPGNNGGDGLAMARLLHNAGVRVEVLVPADMGARTSADHAAQRKILRAMGLPVRRWKQKLPLPSGKALWIDALYGTGLARPITGDAAALIERMHRARARGCKVLALDVPSGISADTGEPIAPGAVCVHADTTATFAALKPGMLQHPERPGGTISPLGIVHLVSIGVPHAILAQLGRPITPAQLDRAGIRLLL